ncbi:MAG: DUF805 domain-containing protein [Pseudomonadota bacterium]
MISFVDASVLFWKRAFDFQGRSSRAEYWWAYLMLVALYVIVLTLGTILSSIPILGAIFGIAILAFYLAAIIPSISIGVRRLHDTDKSGWLILIGLIPIIGLILLYFFCQRGTDGANTYGNDPYGVASSDVFT